MARFFTLRKVLAIVIAVPSLALAGQTAKAGDRAKKTVDIPAGPAAPAQAMRDAVSAVVVVALTEQFNGKDVTVDFGDYTARVVGARERSVTGYGTAHIQGKGKDDAVGFTYRTLYDVVTGMAGLPSISITGIGGGAERMVPNDSGLVDEMQDSVSSAISRDLGGKQVWLQLDRIDSYESGDRYVRIDASGIADLGTDGRSSTRIEALYDLGKKSWLRVNYQLGDDSGSALQGDTTQAGDE